MNEADVRRRYQTRFRKEQRGNLWRIPDAPPVPGPEGRLRSTGQRPFDLVGVCNGGRAVAVEVKFQRGGRTFNAGKKVASHQLSALRDWANRGGLALLVIGWLPKDEHRTELVEVSVEDLRDGSVLNLVELTGRRT